MINFSSNTFRTKILIFVLVLGFSYQTQALKQKTYSISGRVSLLASKERIGMENVTVKLFGSNLKDPAVAYTTTNKKGKYVFSVIANGDYIVTPMAIDGYTFYPYGARITINNNNVTKQNFTATTTYETFLSTIKSIVDAHYDRHTTTILLPNSQVLVAKKAKEDDNAMSTIATAEIYDPQTKQWTLAGTMVTVRHGYTATLLPNGQILVTGGENSDGVVLNSAEIYDPQTGHWTSTAEPMFIPRHGHTATLLPNGQILVAGGYGSYSILNSAEIYDPQTGHWASTGTMVTARHGHTATLLSNGQVLVVGGENSDGVALNSAEIYDPQTGHWTLAGTTVVPRHGHTATLLPNSQVLVAEGKCNDDITDVICTHDIILNSIEIYNPQTKGWTEIKKMTKDPLPKKWILVMRGRDSHDITIDTTKINGAKIYDPQTENWIPTRKKDNYDIIAIDTTKINGAEIYDPQTEDWTPTGKIVTARYYHTATLLSNGQILVTGGLFHYNIFASSELYSQSID